eukprot:7257672-Prorocentrum_lima.AAC.1
MRSAHAMFFDELRKCGAFKLKLEYYETLEGDHPDKSYEWLVNQVQRYIEKKRLDNNRTQLQSHLRRVT